MRAKLSCCQCLKFIKRKYTDDTYARTYTVYTHNISFIVINALVLNQKINITRNDGKNDSCLQGKIGWEILNKHLTTE